MSKSAYRWEEAEIPGAVALCAPAVRLVVVEGWCCDGATGHESHPVAAIRSVVVAHYGRRVPAGADSPARPATHADAIQSGWHFSHSTTANDPLICTREMGLQTAEEAIDASNVEWEVVACPWPPEEDAARLAPIAARLMEGAAANVAMRGPRAAEASTPPAEKAEAPR